MKTRVRIIKFFSAFCLVMLVMVFALNYLNESKTVSFPETLSFNFLNTMLGGIFASSLVVLISETISYCIGKKELVIRILQILQAEYVAFSFISRHIKNHINDDNFYVLVLREKLTELNTNDDTFKEVDISLLCNNALVKLLRQTRINTGASISVFSKLFHSMDGMYDVENTKVSYDGKHVVISATEPLRTTLLSIQKHTLNVCSEINQAMMSLDTKTIGYHWSERKSQLDNIVNG